MDGPSKLNFYHTKAKPFIYIRMNTNDIIRILIFTQINVNLARQFSHLLTNKNLRRVFLQEQLKFNLTFHGKHLALITYQQIRALNNIVVKHSSINYIRRLILPHKL